MLGPECWSISVACSPGVNCLEDLILTFAFFYDVSQETSLHICIPLLWEGGRLGSPASVLMRRQSPIKKCIGWLSFTPSRGEALRVTGIPRVWELLQVNYLLIPQRCLDLSEANVRTQITPFTTRIKLLGIGAFKQKADFAFLQRVGAGRVGPRCQHPAPFFSCQGAEAGVEPAVTEEARIPRGLHRSTPW